jgi:hypothetical protein
VKQRAAACIGSTWLQLQGDNVYDEEKLHCLKIKNNAPTIAALSFNSARGGSFFEAKFELSSNLNGSQEQAG